MTLLTAISYAFLPAKNGGQLAHLYFHNAIQDYLNSIVLSSEENIQGGNTIKFTLILAFKSLLGTYFPFFATYKFVYNINAFKADVFMCSHPYMGASSILACRITNVPLISYSHNIESQRFRSLNKWWWSAMYLYEQWVMKHSARTFFVTQEDKDWALKHYGLDENKCIVSPFGINLSQPPVKLEENKEWLLKTFHINPENIILYFAGAYGYLPNDNAVESILDQIVPRLDQRKIKYTIMIVGGGLSNHLQKKIAFTQGRVIYAGFVDDIHKILDSADIMINPMLLGGGIKTKVVEALGNDIKVISTQNGAHGLDLHKCGSMLWLSDDGDWESFTINILNSININTHIGNAFFEHYAWENVTKRVAMEIDTVIAEWKKNNG